MKKKRIGILFAIVFVLIAAAFFLRPTGYKVIVKSSSYFEVCGVTSDISCKALDPPQVIQKREPYALALFNKDRIHRQFTEKEVTTEWSE